MRTAANELLESTREAIRAAYTRRNDIEVSYLRSINRKHVRMLISSLRQYRKWIFKIN